MGVGVGQTEEMTDTMTEVETETQAGRKLIKDHTGGQSE